MDTLKAMKMSDMPVVRNIISFEPDSKITLVVTGRFNMCVIHAPALTVIKRIRGQMDSRGFKLAQKLEARLNVGYYLTYVLE